MSLWEKRHRGRYVGEDKVKTHRENTRKAEIVVIHPRKLGIPRIAGSPQKLGRSQKGSSPGAFRASVALPTPWFYTSSSQNHGRICVRCVKHPVFSTLGWHTWGTNPGLLGSPAPCGCSLEVSSQFKLLFAVSRLPVGPQVPVCPDQYHIYNGCFGTNVHSATCHLKIVPAQIINSVFILPSS